MNIRGAFLQFFVEGDNSDKLSDLIKGTHVDWKFFEVEEEARIFVPSIFYLYEDQGQFYVVYDICFLDQYRLIDLRQKCRFKDILPSDDQHNHNAHVFLGAKVASWNPITLKFEFMEAFTFDEGDELHGLQCHKCKMGLRHPSHHSRFRKMDFCVQCWTKVQHKMKDPSEWFTVKENWSTRCLDFSKIKDRCMLIDLPKWT